MEIRNTRIIQQNKANEPGWVPWASAWSVLSHAGFAVQCNTTGEYIVAIKTGCRVQFPVSMDGYVDMEKVKASI